jgi:Outer membrane protein beta-barrel domain
MKIFMKKFLFCCFFLIISSTASRLYAQKFHFGILAGINMSNIHITQNTTSFFKNPVYKPISFFSLNGFLSLRTNTNWGISIEPGFIQKGANRGYITMYDPFEEKITFSYIQLPVLYDLYFTKKISLSIGPEFSYLVKSQEKNSDRTINTYDQRKKIEIAGIVGLDYNVFKYVDIGFRYNHAITSTTNLWFDEFGNLIGQTKEYNRYFQLILRVKK